MPKQDNKAVWKMSELEKKFLVLEGEVQLLRREAKARERRISDLEQQLGKTSQLLSKEGIALRFTQLGSCVHHIVFIATKLTGEKNASLHDESSGKPQVSLKEPLLEILDCCLSHEERVTDVEKKCEDNHQQIR